MENKELYVGASRVSQEEVETFPERYVIEACLPACKILWSKNIYTFMCSDSLNPDAWIEVLFNNLSDENKEKIEAIKPLAKRLFSYHEGAINFEVEGSGEVAKEQLIGIANVFSFQDVPEHEAYLTEEEFLIEQGCYVGTPNPNYIPDPYMQEGGIFDIDKVREYIQSKDPTKDTEEFKTFDPNKVVKSIEEYISESGLEGIFYVPQEKRIYNSEFAYKKHLNYLVFLQKKESAKKID